jgi:hypothetical protein
MPGARKPEHDEIEGISMTSTVSPLRKPKPTKPNEQPISQQIGTVESCNEALVLVRTSSGLQHSRRAASCLIAPQVGDTVLLAMEGAKAWILAVLERAQQGPLSIESAQDLVIGSTAGRVRIHGLEGVSVISPADLALQADTVHMQAREGQVLCERLSLLGRSMLAHLGKIEWVGDLLEAVADRMRITSRHSLREVEELDQLRAGSIDHRAEGSYSLRAQNTLVSAKDLVKLDGGQVHLG